MRFPRPALNSFMAGTLFFLLTLPAQAKEHEFLESNVAVQVTEEDLVVSTSGLPDHPWQQVNPNTPTAQNFTFRIPRHPQWSSTTQPVPARGPIAVAVNGVAFFGPEDENGRIALEHHGLDACRGHPTRFGVYHYHSHPACIQKDSSDQHSPVIGYAFDGFKIYGGQGENGQIPSDLDPCNGHADPDRGYHYHTTPQFPFVLGCYHGIPVTGNYDRSQQPGFSNGREGTGGERPGDSLRLACDGNRQRFCPGLAPGPQLHQCMRRNENQFSATCRAAMRQFRPPPR